MSRCTWLLLLVAVGCGDDTIGGLGSACLTTADCVDDLLCFETVGRGNECMAPCDESERLCEDGSVCLAGPSGQNVCYTGGNIEISEECADGGDCVIGGVCIDDGDDSRCRLACDSRRAGGCPEDETCMELTEPDGFCAEPASE